MRYAFALLLTLCCACLALLFFVRHAIPATTTLPSPSPVVVVPASSLPTDSPIRAPISTPSSTPGPTPVPEPVSITLSAVGDCTLGGDVQQKDRRFMRCAQSRGYGYFLENVREIFEADDLTVVNLEGPLTVSNNMRPERPYNFRGRPEYAQILALGGVDCANLANNHIKDFGRVGVEETISALSGVGIASFGHDEMHIAEVKGIKIGLIGLTEWEYTPGEIRSRVRAAREQCDLLIVSMHWGEELRYDATPTQVKCAHALVDAGADLVLGHHSHVLGGIERYKDRYIAYGLANFCFGGNKNPSDKRTLILQSAFQMSVDGTLEGIDLNILPCTVSSSSSANDYRPTPASGKTARQILRKISDLSKQFGDSPDLS